MNKKGKRKGEMHYRFWTLFIGVILANERNCPKNEEILFQAYETSQR